MSLVIANFTAPVEPGKVKINLFIIVPDKALERSAFVPTSSVSVSYTHL